MASTSAVTRTAGSGAERDAPKRNRPKYSRFSQQELPACKPILTPKLVRLMVLEIQNGALKGGKTLNSSIPLREQEDLIVWMRTSAFPTFRKLYGRIYVDLNVNETIIVRLSNNYNTYSFGGKKKLVISTASWIGGRNEFLGFAYLAVGGLCTFLAFAFTILYAIKPRKSGDHNFLSLKGRPGGR